MAHFLIVLPLSFGLGGGMNQGLFLWKLGRLDEAMEAFEDAKTKPRYDHVRYKVCVV